ncbi:hypothetical protein PQG02_25575 [Nostoc sp. UHCC 0926]|uniref:hypothetical protein n=1 Tax=unclassified Nostoc TaxID=2593658 RepID=UPI0023612FBA|nr:hypothetical protein [Nostoc sp. UHCC 0926]WDD32012.1 hypothetical protein PQG02_25575 [Nostoc sp. UHCC 0926]
MRHHTVDVNSNLSQSSLTENSADNVGRKELYLLSITNCPGDPLILQLPCQHQHQQNIWN